MLHIWYVTYQMIDGYPSPVFIIQSSCRNLHLTCALIFLWSLFSFWEQFGEHFYIQPYAEWLLQYNRIKMGGEKFIEIYDESQH